MIIGVIVSYESFALLNGSRIKKKRQNNTRNKSVEIVNSDRILATSKNRLILKISANNL
jgi:hypothetical protein